MNKVVKTVLIYVFGFFAAWILTAVEAAGLDWGD